MIGKRCVKPVLVAGFFVWVGSALAQSPTMGLSDEGVGIVSYAQAASPVPALAADDIPERGVDSRSLALRVQQLEEEVRQLSGLVEEQASLLARLQDQSLERYVEVDRRLAAMADAPSDDQDDPRSDADGKPPLEGVTSPTEPTLAALQPGEQEAYQAAYDLVRGRQFDAALVEFNAFLTAYPFGRYAPNAHFWLGELYLAIEPKNPEAARQNFQALLDQYPADRKVPDALYKLGLAHAFKGNIARSQEYLNRVINDYGEEGHPAAQLAQDFLDSQQ